jgi:TolB-like protein/Tfp pilus assembly protein PilF
MPSSVRFDCFEVDLASGELRKHGIRIHLREQSFQALALLLEQPGQVVTREDLRRRLWTADVFVDFENNLNNAIARLREALGDSAERPRFIETLPKRGYRFMASVSSSDAAAAAAVAKPARMMVLPFLNLSGDPAQEYFSDAMTEEVITELAALAPAHLGVIARTTAMRYKGTQKDVGQIAREVHVDYIVEGGVRRRDDHVTITVQLIRASDQTHLFARRYEADVHDVFDMRLSIAQALAGEVGIAWQGAGGRTTRRPTQDMTAYNLYLRGRSGMFKGTPEGFAAARHSLEEAVSRDPRFALAHDAMADLYWYVGFLGLAPTRDVSATGMFHAMRALDIDDTLAETHALLGLYRKELDFSWDDVKREMDRARELNRSSPLVRLRYAIGWLLPECQLQQAATELELALESDPQSGLLRTWLACVLWLDRRYDGAIQEARTLVEFEPAKFGGHFMLGLALREQGLYEDAIAAHRTAVEVSGGSPLMLGWLGLAQGQGGRTADARATLAHLQTIARAGYVPPTAFAWTHYGLGETDQAFLWMDRAIDGRDSMIMPIQSYPFLDSIRADPRFVPLLRKLNYSTTGAGTCRPLAIAPHDV